MTNIQNPINQDYFISKPGIFLQNMSYPQGMYTTTGSGNFDLYTVPAGRRALFYAIQFTVTVFSATSICTPQLKSGGNYYTIGNPRTFAGASGPQGAVTSMMILEAGESISVNISVTGNTYTHVIGMIEFEGNPNLVTVKNFNMPSGDNLIYTCPSGKRSISLDRFCSIGAASFVTSVQNNTPISFYLYFVPNGQTVGAAYRMTIASAISGSPVGTALTYDGPTTALVAGDRIYMNANASGGNCIATFLEM